MLDAMSPRTMDELQAWNEIEPIGATPVHRLLVFIASCLVNQNRGEKDKPVEMEAIAEFAGLPKEQFETEEESQFMSPEVASQMFRR